MNNWKIIQTFTYPLDAHIVKTYLSANGIESILQDEFTVQANNFYSNAIGGVKLWVHSKEYELAEKCLIDGAFIIPKEKQKTQVTETIENVQDKSTCPFCETDNIGIKKDLSIVSVVFYFVIGALLPFFKKAAYHCFDCEKDWKFKLG